MASVYRQVIWAAPFAHTNKEWIDNSFFEATAPYEDLIGLKDGSALTLEFKAGLGGSQNEDEAVKFPPRPYTVKTVHEFVFDPTDVVLNGTLITFGLLPVVHWPEGTSKTRQASGGLKPYRYSSSNPNVAKVDGALGIISSVSNGAAIITAEDSSGKKQTCRVIVSNVTPGQILYLHLITEAEQKGRVLSLAELESVKHTYNTVHNAVWGDNTFASNYWSSNWVSGSTWRTLHLFNGTASGTAVSYQRMRAIIV